MTQSYKRYGSGGGGGGSQPSLSVSGREDGEAYNVTAGARSLSISNADSASLLTTVERASDGSTVSVTGSTTTTPSWVAPSGSDAGDAVMVRVLATKGSLTSTVGFSERIAGSSASLADLTPVLVDLTDGSWTLYDPDSLVDTVAHSAGWNTITWEAVTASSNYNWSTASGSQRAPRFYKKLLLDTTQVTSTDCLLFTTEMEASRTDSSLTKVILTVAEQPGSTDVALIRAVGGAANKVSTTQISGGAYAYSAETVTQNAALGSTLQTTLRSNDSMGGSLYVALNDSTPATGVSMGSRISNRSNAGAAGAGQDIHVMVGIGPKTSAISLGAGDTQRFQLRYVAATVNWSA